MTENKLLTVIVPVYNGEKYIEETAESILASDYRQIELILLDDGSTDDSRAICEQIARGDARVRYVRQENKGIVATRNRGIELAKGAYLCFCDQDDIVSERMYAVLMEKIQADDAQIAMCSAGRLIDGQKSIYERLESAVLRKEEVRRQLLYPLLFRGYMYEFAESGNYLYGTVWKCIFQKRFIEENGILFHRFINYEDDWIFVTQALSCASSVVTDSMTGYYWRVNSASESHKNRYIENLPRKFGEFDSFTQGYLSQGIIDKEIFREYSKVSLSEHFVELYRNVTNAADPAVRKAAMAELGEYLRRSEYKSALSCRKYLKKSAFRRRMVYTSLRYLGIKTTVAVSRLADFLENMMGRAALLVRIERRLKVNGVEHRYERE